MKDDTVIHFRGIIKILLDLHNQGLDSLTLKEIKDMLDELVKQSTEE